MRIGMILDSDFPPDPRVENEAIALIKAGHEIFLFCLTYGNQPLEEEINGIKVRRFLSNKWEYKLSALAYTFPFYSSIMKKKIGRFIAKNKVQAIHIHDIRIAQAVMWANKKYKLPAILDLHDNMPEVMKLYPHLQKFPGKYLISPKKWKQKEEQFIAKVDHVVTVSQEFVDEVVKRTQISNEKISLVPNTIRKSFYEDAIIEENIIKRYKSNFVILYLGDTHVRRGLQTAIESIDTIRTEIPNVKLVIVGKNTTDPILRQQVKELQLESFVDFEGWQDVSLFPSYIEASDVCISPLHRNIQHDVAYANKLFQYMSFGKPVLVSDAIAQKKLISRINGGLVHKEKDAKDFSDKIMELYNSEELRKQFGENGERFVKNEFSWEHTSKELLTLYNNLSR
ncbi:glycosyltransferase family 4 protein [Flavobacteriaceae bacterium S356]|uniref:Glycosyltransferase family 4 protein n=1 Tax=Asprobacillus argus TaxID=3076534 RepID=A0ABU3LJI4_9FLAO|nr:glycosyltransferase family 4 protein [Flavobacteriaceae bacterium S356]